MKYLKRYRGLFESAEAESEIREILSDLTDDGEFNVSIKYEATLASMDSEDMAILITIDQGGKSFAWNNVSDKVQLLCDMLKDKYPIQIIEANIMLTFIEPDSGEPKFLRTHLQSIDKFSGKLELNLPSKEWIESQSKRLVLSIPEENIDNIKFIRAIHCEFVK